MKLISCISYIVRCCHKMMTDETGPLQKIVKKIEEQRMVNRIDKLDMTTMSWTSKIELTTCITTALRGQEKL